MPGKRNTKKEQTEAETPLKPSEIEDLPAVVSPEKNAYAYALTRVNAVLAAKEGNLQGSVSEQRASHSSAWENLLREDRVTRGHILELKRKENEVLELIRDRVAENLMETIDTAVEQGVLRAPEEV